MKNSIPKAIAPKLPSRLREGKLWTSLFCSLVAISPAAAKPPPRGFEAAVPTPAPAPRPADGSIFNASAGYSSLYQGLRAHAVGDPVTIRLVESTTTSKSAGSKTQRGGGFAVVPPTKGPLSFLSAESLKASAESSFKGDGNATQTSSLTADLSVTIAEVRPNGTALLRGEKRMLLSQGQEWVQFSGIVRLADIDQDNQVPSSRVADARIEYSGNGPIQRAGREGWLSKFFNMISPF